MTTFNILLIKEMMWIWTTVPNHWYRSFASIEWCVIFVLLVNLTIKIFFRTQNQNIGIASLNANKIKDIEIIVIAIISKSNTCYMMFIDMFLRSMVTNVEANDLLWFYNSFKHSFTLNEDFYYSKIHLLSSSFSLESVSQTNVFT